MKFVTRAYNSFSLNPITKSSIIKISEEERLKGEIEYYLNIPNELKIFFPRVINYELNCPYKMELEYYAYNNLGNVIVESKYDDVFWEKTFDFILGYINSYRQSKTINFNQKDSFLMFIDKTEKEYSKLVHNFEFFDSIKNEDEFILNQKVLKSFNKVWPRLKNFIEKSFDTDKFYYIHGDLCFSNILYGINPFTDDLILKMIDPRGVFGETKYFGDFYYDLAKISHSCNGGYEHFIYDKFNIEVNKNSFRLKYKNQKNKNNINKKFIQLISKFNFDYQKIKLIEGCIFIGMCARHYDSLERQKAMFITGLNILNEIYETL